MHNKANPNQEGTGVDGLSPVREATKFYSSVFMKQEALAAEAATQAAEAAAAGAAAVEANLAVTPESIARRFSFLPGNLQDSLINNVFGLSTEL